MIGALMNDGEFCRAEGVGTDIGFENGNVSFSAEKQYALVKYTKTGYVLAGSHSRAAIQYTVEPIADIDLKISFVKGHFFRVDFRPQNLQRFDANGRSGIQNSLSFVGHEKF